MGVRKNQVSTWKAQMASDHLGLEDHRSGGNSTTSDTRCRVCFRWGKAQPSREKIKISCPTWIQRIKLKLKKREEIRVCASNFDNITIQSLDGWKTTLRDERRRWIKVKIKIHGIGVENREFTELCGSRIWFPRQRDDSRVKNDCT